MKKYQLPEYGEFPILLLSGKSGIALFPANLDPPKLDLNSKNTCIDHFAFNVSKENFEKAKSRYTELNLEYNIQDTSLFSFYLYRRSRRTCS